MLRGRPNHLTPRPAVPTPVIRNDPAGSGQITDQGSPGRGGRAGRRDQQDWQALALVLVVEAAPAGLDEPHRQSLPIPFRSCSGGGRKRRPGEVVEGGADAAGEYL